MDHNIIKRVTQTLERNFRLFVPAAVPFAEERARNILAAADGRVPEEDGPLQHDVESALRVLRTEKYGPISISDFAIEMIARSVAVVLEENGIS